MSVFNYMSDDEAFLAMHERINNIMTDNASDQKIAIERLIEVMSDVASLAPLRPDLVRHILVETVGCQFRLSQSEIVCMTIRFLDGLESDDDAMWA